MSATRPTSAARFLQSQRLPRVGTVVSVAYTLITTVVLAAALAPLIAPYDPEASNFLATYQGPSMAHWLGTDGLGRDTLSRLIYGARTALLGPLLVVLISTVFGMLLGLVAAWKGGILDAILSRVFDLMFAFPALLVAILAVALFGKGLAAPVIAMSVAYIPFVARLTRSLVLAERNRSYVAAYQVQGFSGTWIALRRILPNVTPIVGAQTTLNFGYVLAELAALSFLGLGVQPPTPDWGAMLNESQSGILAGHFLPAIVPAIAVVLVVVSVNLVGEELSARIGGARQK